MGLQLPLVVLGLLQLALQEGHGARSLLQDGLILCACVLVAALVSILLQLPAGIRAR